MYGIILTVKPTINIPALLGPLTPQFGSLVQEPSTGGLGPGNPDFSEIHINYTIHAFLKHSTLMSWNYLAVL